MGLGEFINGCYEAGGVEGGVPEVDPEMVKSWNVSGPVRRHLIIYEYEGGGYCMIRSWVCISRWHPQGNHLQHLSTENSTKPYRGVTCPT
jgi:hypothetical protein